MTAPEGQSERTPSLWQLFVLHLRVGNLTFGGGDPSLAALYTEMVDARRWITPEQYGIVFALARITPGTSLLAFCAGVSWRLLGWFGAIAAVLAMTVPAAIVVVGLTRSYALLQAHPVAVAALAGVLAAAVGMMPAAAWQLAKPYVRSRHAIHAFTMIGAAFGLSVWHIASPVQILGLAAVGGCLWSFQE